MLTTFPADDTAFAAAIDYLPVAVRAAYSNPGNTTLWAEAYRAQRAVIEYADANMGTDDAAGVQALVGVIAGIAEWSNDYARAHGVAWSEGSKAKILALLAAEREAAAAHVELFENEPIDLTSTIDSMISGWLE